MASAEQQQPAMMSRLHVLLCIDNTRSMLDGGAFTVSGTQTTPQYALHDAAVHAAESLIKMLGRRINLATKYSVWSMGDGLQAPMTSDQEHVQSVLRMLPRPSNTPRMNVGHLLGQIFNYLHLLRMENYMDNFSGGFYPNVHQPTIILFITNGGLLPADGAGGTAQFNIPGLTAAGCQQYIEPFRWDQRLYTLLLKSASDAQTWVERVSAVLKEERLRNGVAVGYVAPSSSDASRMDVDNSTKNGVNTMEYWLDKMAGEMNGQLLTATCQFSLNRCLEYLAGQMGRQRSRDAASGLMPAALRSFFPTGVSISFYSPAVDEKRKELRETRVVMIPESVNGFSKIGQNMDVVTLKAFGYWPIPEGWTTDPARLNIPKRRSCRPEIKYRRNGDGTDWSLKIPNGLVNKKYLLDPNMELVKDLLMEPPGTCWLCYVVGSSGSTASDGYPFGFIRAKNDFKGAYLWILPYNFTTLFSLLDISKQKRRSTEWYHGFKTYLNTCPFYYMSPLKRALSASVLGIPGKCIAMIDSLASGCHLQAYENLKTMQQLADKQRQTMLSSVKKEETIFRSDQLKKELLAKPLPLNAFDTPRDLLMLTWRQMNLKFFPDNAPKIPMASLRRMLSSSGTNSKSSAKSVVMMSGSNDTTAARITTVLDRWSIPPAHRKVVGPRTREQEIQDKLHLVSVAKAGDYSEKAKNSQRLRFVDEEDEFRFQKLAFGNPYKRLKFQPDDFQESTIQLESPVSEIEREAINSISSRERSQDALSGGANTSIIWKRGHPQHQTMFHGSRDGAGSFVHQLKLHRLSYLAQMQFDPTGNDSIETLRKSFDDAMKRYKRDLERARLADAQKPTTPTEVESVSSEEPEMVDYETQGQYMMDEMDMEIEPTDDVIISMSEATDLSPPLKRSVDVPELADDIASEPPSKRRPVCPPTPISNASNSSDSEPELPFTIKPAMPTQKRPEPTPARPAITKSTSASASGLNMKRYVSMIRNPGRSQDKVLLKELQELDVDAQQKRQICQELITEARRFKKSALISDLEGLLSKLP